MVHVEECKLQKRNLYIKTGVIALCKPSNFKEYYCGMSLEKRKTNLLKKAARGEMRVDLAVDEAAGQKVAYCVSSLNEEKTGEIESIFVNDTYKGLGIGDSLMKKALSWMDQKGAMAKIVEVGTGNEQAFNFYAR
jgi:ribosomal protein S18 acetylase RimI-like enzyme